ncbi:nibrin [Colias croceus]|uniref:nibrin n=1 Tax=Colias crocea TaxID=72248 RepID=UPI001E27DC4E|nr:nibrin [Colias croceus]
MWFLTSEHDERVIYVLEDKKIIIGRSVDAQNCNFAVPDDPSLSRKHATLSLSDNDLVLQDAGSKYGTYLNDSSEKLEGDVIHKLSSGDIVKFGKMNCVWKVNKLNFVTCTSTIKGEILQALKINWNKLGVSFKSEWDDSCSHLTMPAITLTIKVVLALVQGSSIVTPEFWTKCIEAINNNSTLPSSNDFVPQVVESTLNKEAVSFLPDEKRKLLFCGKKFIFFSKRQLEMYKLVLKKSSAIPLLLSESKMTKTALCEQNVIVIQYNITTTSQESQAQKDQINDIVNYLKSNKKRVIADAEIGLAVLYCSTNKYCNPDFNFSSEVIKQVGPATKNNKILAQESQEPTQKLHEKENVVINESLHSKNEINHGTEIDCLSKGKRKLEDDEDNHVDKKKVTENVLSANKKRVADEELNHNSKKIALGNSADDDNMFNFVSTKINENDNSNDTTKKLNLSKPSKRKLVTEDNDEDDLFNFVNSKKPCVEKSDFSTTNDDSDEPQIKTIHERKQDNIDLEKLRGSKLQELMAANASKVVTRNIKKEDLSDLDEKFSSIDIGSTTIVIRHDLIVKREPLEIKAADGSIKNFKKFKKVWPVKMQISIIS